MAEFTLNTGGFDMSKLEPFVKGYVEAAFWTETGSDHEEEGLGPESYVGEVSAESWGDILHDCKEFQEKAKALLDEAYATGKYSAERAGHDFWLTRNGHGAGFWDRDELEPNDLGDRLTQLAREAGEVYVVRGDDGKIHF